MELNDLSSMVAAGENLTEAQSIQAADLLASSEVSADAKASFLTGLAKKGEVASEVSGLAKRFRELARNPGLEAWQEQAIDVCGTGGDKIGSFNISTTVVFGLAAAGVPVFKHGNKSITSKCGSANLLEALGVPLMADDATLKRSMEELGFCFMFAPAFHPAFKEIMPVRQQLAQKGQRTVFNILGPLINPARPAHQLLGVFSADVVEMLADSLHAIGVGRGLVAHCKLADGRGMDELSAAGTNVVRGFGDLRELDEDWSPEALGLELAPLDSLLGGEIEENLEILKALLAGKAPRGLEDTVALSIAAGLYAVGRYKSVREGIGEARELILGGAMERKLAETKEFYA